MKLAFKFSVASLSLVVAGIAMAQPDISISGGGTNVTFHGSVSNVDAGALAADPTLAGAWTFDLVADTLSDVLIIDAGLTVYSGSLYNVPEAQRGSDSHPPSMMDLNLFPVLAADTFMTSPGMTSQIGVLDDICRMFLVSDSSDDGAQSGFSFGQITIVPDANGELSAELTGRFQTRGPSVVYDEFVYSFGGTPPPRSLTFENVLMRIDRLSGYFPDSCSNPSITASNDTVEYPNGVSMFAPSDNAIDGQDVDVDRFLVVDDGREFVPDSGDRGWSLDDLLSLVPNEGDSTTLTAFSEHRFELVNDGGVNYGGASVIESRPADNGWIHVLDAVPVPLPDFGSICDLNADGRCNVDDLTTWYADPNQFDFDSDGEIGAEDVAFWLELASDSSKNAANPGGRQHVFGDLDLDFDVDSIDLGILLNNFLDTAATPAEGRGWEGGDMTIDGTVNAEDLGHLLLYFNFSSPLSASVVPEPSSLLLLFFGAFRLFAKSRRARRSC